MTGEAAGANALTAVTRGEQAQLAFPRGEGGDVSQQGTGRPSQASANTNGQLTTCGLPSELKPGDR